MRVGQMVRQLCGTFSASIHETRLRAVVAVTQAIAATGRLSISAVGRAVEASAFVKHRSKRVDRLPANPRVEARCLRNLRRVLPDGWRPIIVTDAGFRGPFLHQLQTLGWDFVGRLRSNTRMKPLGGAAWTSVPELYATATKRPRKLGSF